MLARNLTSVKSRNPSVGWRKWWKSKDNEVKDGEGGAAEDGDDDENCEDDMIWNV